MANSEERREDRKLVSIELVSLSARVTSVKFQKGLRVSDPIKFVPLSARVTNQQNLQS